jgi:tetratricopeptide (TPR) repeat protein
MKHWLPPYRACVLTTDKILLTAANTAVQNTEKWEIIYANSAWEALFFAINTGVHVILLPDTLDKNDISLETLDEMRYIACRKFPLPFLLIKTSGGPSFKRISLSKNIQLTGILSQIKFELNNMVICMESRESPISSYYDLQFTSFIKGKHEDYGAILKNDIPEHYLVHAITWALNNQNKIEEAEHITNKYMDMYPKNPFLHALKACFLYKRKLIPEARENLDYIINENNTNPLMLYFCYIYIDQYKDYHAQYALVDMLTQLFPHAYTTQLISALWNCRMGYTETGVTQLLKCLESVPSDLFAASALINVLRNRGYEGLCSGIKGYVSSVMLKSNAHQHLFSNLLGIRQA